MDKLIIGLVGEKGSGKATFATILQELLPNKTVISLTFSKAILAPTLDIWHLAQTRENLQKVAVAMEEKFGDGTVAHAMFETVLKQTAEIIIIDGVRWQTDADLIRKFEKNILIYITAPLQLRFNRTRSRKEKTGEDTTSFEQFLNEEHAKNEIYIPHIGKNADYKIVNNKGVVEFKRSIQKFVLEYLK